jgi:hypothetical protein
LVDGLGKILSGALADLDRCHGSGTDRRIVLRLGPPQLAASFIRHAVASFVMPWRPLSARQADYNAAVSLINEVENIGRR